MSETRSLLHEPKTCFGPLFFTTIFVMFFGMLAANPAKSEICAPLTIQDSLGRAEQSNNEVAVAKAQIFRQSAEVDSSSAAKRPVVSVDSQYFRIQDSRIPEFQGEKVGPDYNWLASVEGNQSVYDAGRSRADLQEQRLIQKSLQHDYEKVLHDVQASVKEKFFDLLQAQETYKLYEQTPSLSDTDRKEYLTNAQESVAIARIELAKVMSVDPSEADCLSVTGSLDSSVPANAGLISIKNVTQDRPDLKRWEALRESTYSAEEAALAGKYPTLNVIASYGGETAVLEDRLGGEVHGWTAGVKASWDIFDGHLSDARAKAATADRMLYEASKKAAETDGDFEIRKTSVAFNSAIRLVTLMKNQSLKKKADKDEIFQQQIGYINALHDYQVAKTHLEHALGTDLNDVSSLIEAPATAEK